MDAANVHIHVIYMVYCTGDKKQLSEPEANISIVKKIEAEITFNVVRHVYTYISP